MKKIILAAFTMLILSNGILVFDNYNEVKLSAQQKKMEQETRPGG
ncbi:hypothetical protein IKE_02610 [Bacillus cereus VD196]|uniref:Uncharacterized protein n=2 Tax=Bacillus cereus group TaxID=86661 RepID=A0A9W3SD60_BACTU|nr:hypothetical protein [Bacillus cereus]ANS49313.1 hypothetical protein BT246_39670 [Bacillus thuringiensis]EOO67483.1 hypothetical protein IKE_02610 [Bacillus cereus VD196]